MKTSCAICNCDFEINEIQPRNWRRGPLRQLWTHCPRGHEVVLFRFRHQRDYVAERRERMATDHTDARTALETPLVTEPRDLQIEHYVKPYTVPRRYCYVFAMNVSTAELGLTRRTRQKFGLVGDRTWILKIGVAVDCVQRGERILNELRVRHGVQPQRMILLRVFDHGSATESYLKAQLQRYNIRPRWRILGATEIFLAEPVLALHGWTIPTTAPVVTRTMKITSLGGRRKFGEGLKALMP